ncbi:MAG: potassium transporter TrkG [Cyanobacteriota bacterium]|nr:potassium transporter TrkG [Cyanobacteriota bacterium]
MKVSFLQRIINKLGRSHPVRLLLFGYGAYILIAWVLLCLPISWQSEAISTLDNLFIATSAISTTGLVTVNTPDAYNFFGELVIALAFQVGGLGYMTLGSFALIYSKNSLSNLRQRVGSAVFSLPQGFNLKEFIQHTVIFTLLVEAAGIISLYILFKNANVSNPFWAAVFHSISAFCTAGFSVFPNSLEDFRGDFGVNLVISILSILGAVGFLVASDIWQSLTKRNYQTTLTTRIILYVTAWFLIVGFLLLFFLDESMKTLPLGEHLLAAWFQSMTSLTTVGFNTHPIGVLSAVAVFLTLILMIVGASPSGTGGGLKSTSVFAALAVMWTSLQGKKFVGIFGRRIPDERLFTAFSSLVFYIIAFLLGSSLLLIFQNQPFEDVIFEAASALGTVGLSRGITSDLVPMGKIIIILLMYIGRLGPLTFGIALFYQKSTELVVKGEEDLAI